MVEEAVPLGTAIQTSPWTPALITALFTGIVGLLGAVATMLGGLFTLWHTQKTALMAQQAAIVEQKAVNQDVGAKMDRVHSLVNAGDSARLEEIARALRRIAVLTKNPNDVIAADAADENVRRKAADTAKAEHRMDIATQTAAVVAQVAASGIAPRTPDTRAGDTK